MLHIMLLHSLQDINVLLLILNLMIFIAISDSANYAAQNVLLSISPPVAYCSLLLSQLKTNHRLVHTLYHMTIT